MADKKLNEVNQITDFDYVLGVKGTEVTKMTKAEFASMVGGLMSTLKIFPFDSIDANSSMDFQKNSLKSGIYYVNESNNKPANLPFGYGVIVRFKTSVYGVMLGADVVGKKLYLSYGTEVGFGSWILIK